VTASFPQHPWVGTAPPADIDLKRLIEETAAEILAYWGGARDFAAVAAHLQATLPGKRIAVYGAGTHSERLIDIFRTIPGLEIAAFLDRRWESLKELGGVPVLEPAAWESLAVDFILLSFDRAEGGLLSSLVEAGLPQDRLVPIYGHPDYLARTLGGRYRTLGRDWDFTVPGPPAGYEHIEHVIVASYNENKHIIDDAALAAAYPVDRTLLIAVTPPDCRREESRFRTLDVGQQLGVLFDVLRALRPRTIYLSSSHEFDQLSFLVRAAAPDAALFHEICDFFVLFRDDWMKYGGVSDRFIARMRQGAWLSGQVADMVISKRAGPSWGRMVEDFKSAYRFYAPAVPIDGTVGRWAPPDAARRTSVRLLYAGALPPPDFAAVLESDYNFLPLFDALTEQGDVEGIDLYNSLHGPGPTDGPFAWYVERYRHGPVRYHRRIALNDLLIRSEAFDFGWLCLPPRRSYHPDQDVVVCNRFSTYVLAGLPVVIDAAWEHQAALVAEFGAGVVLEEATAETVAAALRSCDRAAARAGVRRLAEHLQTGNRAVVAELRAGISALSRG
jgi:hypothetical protein